MRNTASFNYDVIVVGAGHAGVEAALAAARMGCKTLLLTANLDTIAKMSCNPAIGGLAKGHIVREIDALGGEMGGAADKTGIQFRMLNTKKGPSVWAPRAQCDKIKYQFLMKQVVEKQANLCVKQTTVDRIIVENQKVIGITTITGVTYLSSAVVLTTGTFLCGLIHIGNTKLPAGRSGDPAVFGISKSLAEFNFELGRMKTGTPPRLNRRSINFAAMQRQDGDESPAFFSHRTDEKFHVEQVPCFITHTTDETKKTILNNLHLSPLYSGEISGVGPRYCPSIEDKIVKFPEKESHQIFLEPEGLDTEELYVNGASSSMPEIVQNDIIHSIIGLERAEITRPAYAVEYDYVLPHQLHPSLETKKLENLFLAGQINGTSGYEEAAGQGIIAGINAARKCQHKAPIILTRADAYIGVLIDDLITRSTEEPYRMFTSRAEYRLQLRQDNADLRLTPIGRECGLVDDATWADFVLKRNMIAEEINRLSRVRNGSLSYLDILRRPEISYESLPVAQNNLPSVVKRQIEIQVKYEGYINRDLEQIEKFKQLEMKKLPKSIEYENIAALRYESRHKLAKYKPDTIGQASRISGVTPADIGVLLVWIKRFESEQKIL
jgi:tRNA uridine 5-carboxymethylaminomethyl modification enzyme